MAKLFADVAAFLKPHVKKDFEFPESFVGNFTGTMVATEVDLTKLANSTSKDEYFTTNHVLDLFFTSLARAVSYSYAAKVADQILNLKNNALQILRPNQRHELRALDLLAECRIPFIDCITLALLEDNSFSSSEPVRHSYADNKIFIDTSAFLALHLPSDNYHNSAHLAWEKLQNERLYTSNFVLEESVTLLINRASNYRTAVDDFKRLFTNSSLQILRPDAKDELEGLKFFKQYAALNYSFTDCVSFALMKKNEIRKAFTYDTDFKDLFILFPSENARMRTSTLFRS